MCTGTLNDKSRKCKFETFLLVHTSVPIVMLKVVYSLSSTFFFFLRSRLVKTMELVLRGSGFSSTKALPNLPIYSTCSSRKKTTSKTSPSETSQCLYCISVFMTSWSSSEQSALLLRSFISCLNPSWNTPFPLVFNAVRFCTVLPFVSQ